MVSANAHSDAWLESGGLEKSVQFPLLLFGRTARYLMFPSRSQMGTSCSLLGEGALSRFFPRALISRTLVGTKVSLFATTVHEVELTDLVSCSGYRIDISFGSDSDAVYVGNVDVEE